MEIEINPSTDKQTSIHPRNKQHTVDQLIIYLSRKLQIVFK